MMFYDGRVCNRNRPLGAQIKNQVSASTQSSNVGAINADENIYMKMPRSRKITVNCRIESDFITERVRIERIDGSVMVEMAKST